MTSSNVPRTRGRPYAVIDPRRTGSEVLLRLTRLSESARCVERSGTVARASVRGARRSAASRSSCDGLALASRSIPPCPMASPGRLGTT
ncbi:MAG: hypothetical protein MZV70_63910 [Desulfobacterales bacterium]|nr:hypothetical protein [Desulfobacterales bacterium]